jgi:hypothetical protein
MIDNELDKYYSNTLVDFALPKNITIPALMRKISPPGHRIENRSEVSLSQNCVRDFLCASANQRV